MKRISCLAVAICISCHSWLHAESTASLSGVYQKLTLGVDPASGTVTGYFSDIDEPPNRPRSECSFYLAGKMQGGKYAIQAWQPAKPKSEPTAGELTIFSGGSSVRLKLDKLSRDCTALNPKLGKDEGALLDRSKPGNWTSVRVVGTGKSGYYQTPDLGSPQRDSARKGTVLTVSAEKSGWDQVQSEQKPKGWIQESDLYPTSPGEPMLEAAKPAAPLVVAVPPQAEPKTSPVPEKKVDTKADLLQTLKSMDGQAFELALRVLRNPAERITLRSSRLTLEQDFNSLIEALNKIDSNAYRTESARIYETYLDLQYVLQAQPVVSLRLQEEILKQSR